MQTRGIDMSPEHEAQTSAMTGRATKRGFFAAVPVSPRPTAEQKERHSISWHTRSSVGLRVSATAGACRNHATQEIPASLPSRPAACHQALRRWLLYVGTVCLSGHAGGHWRCPSTRNKKISGKHGQHVACVSSFQLDKQIAYSLTGSEGRVPL